MTVPQLVCLRQLAQNDQLTTGQLARRVFLSQATVTGILDRLERKELVNRERSQKDRRRVLISLTQAGERLIEEMPRPLQERFSQSLTSMSGKERVQLDKTLKRLVKMMESPPTDIWHHEGP
jgi:DNA-binding MarR family transcriptional regulator